MSDFKDKLAEYFPHTPRKAYIGLNKDNRKKVDAILRLTLSYIEELIQPVKESKAFSDDVADDTYDDGYSDGYNDAVGELRAKAQKDLS